MYHKNNDIRSIRSKEWIFEALSMLIETKPYHEITITELIQKAGVGRSTFYRNYDVIDDVLVEKLDREFEEFYSYIFNAENLTNLTFSTNLFIPVFKYWQKESMILEVVLKANRFDLVHSIFVRYVDFILKKFQILPLTDKDLEYSTVMLSASIESVMIKWLLGGKKETPAHLADVIEKTLFNNKAHQ